LFSDDEAEAQSLSESDPDALVFFPAGEGSGGEAPGGSGGGITQFTYLVDSDQALADWANNVAGNDYSSVLIAPGTWSSSVEVNLSASGTKVVVGVLGSLLSFPTSSGLRYVAESPECFMRGVSVDTSVIGFYFCNNLIHCRVVGADSGFVSCDNLVNCYAVNAKVAFYDCDNLVNCSSFHPNSGGSEDSDYVGFHACSHLSNCVGNGKGSSGSFSGGFKSCSDLVNCVGSANTNGSSSNSAAFIECNRLSNCRGSGTGPGNSRGFASCLNLVNCRGSSNSVASSSGFASCSGLLFNSGSYVGCFVSPSGTGVSPADSAEGGWNVAE
jgi:hypothetical protein